MANADSYDSIWTIKESDRQFIEGDMCRTGVPMKCGDQIRLESNNTGRNLHTHSGFKAPLSGRQEVSGYGEDGFGDAGDDWILECNDKPQYGRAQTKGSIIEGSTLFFLKHMDTNMYLMTDTTDFNRQNCPRCPIIGHFEVSAVRAKTQDTLWSVHSGFIFPVNEVTPEDEPSRHQFTTN